MNLALTSDFPSTANQAVFDCMRSRGGSPRIAWIPPFSVAGRERFPSAKELFASYGFTGLEYCDIDAAPDTTQLSHLDQYDVIYLTGGNPIEFRRNIIRSGLAVRLQQCLAAGSLIIGASGGALQLTRNVSLFRLVAEPLDQVFADHREYEGLNFVGYEFLPHLNRLESSFLDKVRGYSERLTHDIIALADGAAVLHTTSDDFQCVGEAARFRSGVMMPIEVQAR